MSGLIRYSFERVLWAVPVLLGASFITFTITHLAPGDPAQFMLGDTATPERLESLREELGLNDPFHIQFYSFLTGAVQGDLGMSVRSRQPVSEMIRHHLPYTVQLGVASLLVSLAVSFPLGILSAVNKDTVTDQGSRVVALLGISVPNFWLGLVLILLIAVRVSAIPLYGMTLVTDDLVQGIYSTILPAIALGTAMAAIVMRLIRGGVLDELSKGYVQTAHAYGIDRREVVYVYVLKNAVLPTITVIGLQMGYLMGGSVIIETVFGIPGIGRLALQAIFQQDLPVLQGVILLVAVAFIAINLLVDITYTVLDPRIRYGGEDS